MSTDELVSSLKQAMEESRELRGRCAALLEQVTSWPVAPGSLGPATTALGPESEPAPEADLG
jgi:hypothetical protein